MPTPPPWPRHSRRESGLIGPIGGAGGPRTLSPASGVRTGKTPVPREMDRHHADPRRRLRTRFARLWSSTSARPRPTSRIWRPSRPWSPCSWTASWAGRAGGPRSTAWARRVCSTPDRLAEAEIPEIRDALRDKASRPIGQIIAPLKHLARWLVEHHGRARRRMSRSIPTSVRPDWLRGELAAIKGIGSAAADAICCSP